MNSILKGSLPIWEIVISAEKPRSRAYPSDRDISLGACLRRRRLGLGWLQEDAAEYLGVTVEGYGNYELNKTAPRISKRKKIVKFLEKNWWDDESGTLANRCLSYRSQEGLSIYELSRRVRMSEKTIIRIEKGNQVSKDAMERIRAFLETNH